MHSVDFDPLFFFLLSLPFILLLVTMVGLKFSALKAGILAVLLTLMGISYLFDMSLAQLSGDVLPGSMLESLVTSASILWIIFAALCIYYAQLQSGAIRLIQQQLSRLHSDPRVSALFIAWFFSMFMEGAAGFGTSAALTAPFLVAAGYRPVIAVVLALWGHSLGVAFGAVGTPVISQANLLGLPELPLAHAVLPYLPAATIILAAGLAWGTHYYHVPQSLASNQPNPGGGLAPRRTRSILLLGTLAGVCFLVPSLAIAYLTGPELPTLLGSLLGALLFVVVARRLIPTDTSAQPSDDKAPLLPFVTALAPYIILIVLVLITRLVTDLQQWLQALRWQFNWGDYQASIQYMYHPGSLLMLAFLLGALVQRQSISAIYQALRHAAGRVVRVVLALFIMLLLARLLVHSGAVFQLGQQFIAIAGATWPFWGPWFGVLGTFITGSATSPNILLSELQQAAAKSANIPAHPMLGSQTYGAAVGNMVCPHNIIAAGATVNIQGEEGKVMRYTLPMTIVLSIAGGVTALMWVGWMV